MHLLLSGSNEKNGSELAPFFIQSATVYIGLCMLIYIYLFIPVRILLMITNLLPEIMKNQTLFIKMFASLDFPLYKCWPFVHI